MARHVAKLLNLNGSPHCLYRHYLYGSCIGPPPSPLRCDSLCKKLTNITSRINTTHTKLYHCYSTVISSFGGSLNNRHSSCSQCNNGLCFSSIANSTLCNENIKGKVLCDANYHYLRGHNAFYSNKDAGLNSGILKNQSALLVKRSPRKKNPKIYDEGKTRQLNNVVAYALGEEIKLEPLKIILMKQGLYAIGELPSDANDTLHVRGKYNVDQKPKEIFVFDDGSVVFWCMPEVERGAFIKLLMKYCESPYHSAVVLSEREELDVAYVKGQSGVLDNVIQLKEKQEDANSNDKVLELYAFSNAMSQSVKLSVWEASLDKFVSSIETVTQDVRQGRKISMSRRQLLKKSGELMSLRHLINLSSDLLDTPDFYWDRAYLETLYQSLCTQQSITKRTKVINEKLTHCCELVDLISHHLSDEHHIRLEIMIIILILVEVVFEVIHFVKDYLDLKPAKAVSEDDERSNVSPKN